MINTILFLIQTGVELSSNLFTLLLGGPILDVLFDPIDVIISGVLALS
ncbi:MAG: hypothetical protein ACE5F9_04755 [Phycisphaerae bacterium]